MPIIAGRARRSSPAVSVFVPTLTTSRFFVRSRMFAASFYRYNLGLRFQTVVSGSSDVFEETHAKVVDSRLAAVRQSAARRPDVRNKRRMAVVCGRTG